MRFIDSNVFIYHMASDPIHGPDAEAILRRVEGGEETVTSTLTLVQTCSYLRWKRAADKIPLFISFLQSLPKLTKDETRLEDFSAAIELSKKLGVSINKWDDFVIAAQMLRLNVNEIYSNDSDFDRISGIRRLFRRS
jgi:predicted nucleic acid-binding protein